MLRVRVLGFRVQGLLGSKGPFLDKRVSARAFLVVSWAISRLVGIGTAVILCMKSTYYLGLRVQGLDLQGIVLPSERPHCTGLAFGQAGYLRPV